MPWLLVLPPPDPGFEMVISRPGISQGLSQTDGVQLFPRAFLQFGAVRVGGQWRNVDAPTAGGVAAIFVSGSHTFGKVEIDAAARYRIKTDTNREPHSEAWEFSLGARRRFGKLGVHVDADYSFDEFGAGQSFWVEGGPSFRIDGVTEISASIGRRKRASAPDYTGFNVGVRRSMARPVSIDLRYYGTSRPELGDRYQGRVRLSVRLAL